MVPRLSQDRSKSAPGGVLGRSGGGLGSSLVGLGGLLGRLEGVWGCSCGLWSSLGMFLERPKGLGGTNVHLETWNYMLVILHRTHSAVLLKFTYRFLFHM